MNFTLSVSGGLIVAIGGSMPGLAIGLIGMKAMVMDGAVIESDVVLAAGAVVPPGKVLKSGWLYMGSPAKPARELTEKELSYFTYTAANYVKLKNTYRG